jgi:hypothetical protein
MRFIEMEFVARKWGYRGTNFGDWLPLRLREYA